jgi:hypothetical protein
MMSSFSDLAQFGFLDPGTLALKVLAVVGAFTVGAVVTGWLAKLLAKMMGFQTVYPFLLRWSRLLGGLAIGLVVWSGIGGGGNGWWPFGQGGGAGNSGSGEASGPKPPSNQGPTNPEQTLRVQMRGGAEPEKDDKFYVIEGEKPRTWEDLESVLKERKKNSNLKIIEIVISKRSVDEDNPAVKKLKNWAKENGVAVTMVMPS